MRLLTHNLMCCLKCKHFPLDITADDINFIKEQTYDRVFVQRMLGRIEYEILAQALEQVRQSGHAEELKILPVLPAKLEELDVTNDNVLHCIHIAMSAIMIRNGALVCPSCTTSFEIKEYIPNLMSEE